MRILRRGPRDRLGNDLWRPDLAHRHALGVNGDFAAAHPDRSALPAGLELAVYA
ncbi:MAG: hypothetical protein M3303_10200 [Gemmatimonadota bacterium]|nr:hypothetical protein [Gemmatimonadota bacterium]